MDMQTLIAAGAAAGAILAVFALIGYVVRTMRKLTREFSNFREDWAGEAGRPGVPARPGVLERLTSIEHELKTNGGSSLKDAVNRVDRRLVDVEAMVSDINKSTGI